MLNKEKYGNVILYLCNELGGKIEGKKKLAKLLYYVDFDHFQYKESMKSITGDTYRAKRMGPYPESLDAAIDYLERVKKLRVSILPIQGVFNPAQVYESLAEAPLEAFTDTELYIMKLVIRKYGHLTGYQLANLTHSEAPYLGSELDDKIPFEFGFYRDTQF
jgi:uncharacterized phage-associated protein